MVFGICAAATPTSCDSKPRVGNPVHGKHPPTATNAGAGRTALHFVLALDLCQGLSPMRPAPKRHKSQYSLAINTAARCRIETRNS